MQNLITNALTEALNPMFIEVVDESHMHSVPAGAQSHFKVTVVSEAFLGKPLIQRHRQVNQLLQAGFDRGLHALALHTMTPEEWAQKGGVSPESPKCHGGSKQHTA